MATRGGSHLKSNKKEVFMWIVILILVASYCIAIYNFFGWIYKKDR